MKQILIPDRYSEINPKKINKIINWINARLSKDCINISYEDYITRIIFQKNKEYEEFYKLFMDKELLKWNNEKRN